MLTTFPDWNNRGIVPPIPADPLLAAGHPRSPYAVSLLEVVQRFSTSPKRIAILRGFLQYRTAFHRAGLAQGFQWLDGSFLENKEAMLGQDPGDIDVATFYHLPAGTTQAQLAIDDPLAFGPDGLARKARYSVDAYLISLGMSPVERLVARSHYWYGVFSHSRRNLLWKGFLQIDLASGEDADANTLLANLGGATP